MAKSYQAMTISSDVKYVAVLLLVASVMARPSASQEVTGISAGAPSPAHSYLPAPASVQGTPLDQVVATVNGDLILDSDVNEELRFDALNLDQDQLGPVTDAPETVDRSAAIERLINRELILQQIKLEPHPATSDQELNDEIAKLRSTVPACRRFNCKTEAGWHAYLDSIHVTEQAFREHWRERMQVLAFTEQRFRMGIRITPDQEKAYYTQTLLPEYRKAKVAPPPFDSISERIQEVLIEQQVSALLSDWLHSLRAQGSVIVLHPGEVAP